LHAFRGIQNLYEALSSILTDAQNERAASCANLEMLLDRRVDASYPRQLLFVDINLLAI